MKNNPSDKVTTQFTTTKEDRELIAQHANRARLTVSQFCKMAVFSRINNYPLKKGKNARSVTKMIKEDSL